MGKKSAAQKRAERDPEWAAMHYAAVMAERGEEGPHGRDIDHESSFSARQGWTEQMQRARERAQARLERQQASTASASTGPAANVAASSATWTQGALTEQQAKALWIEATNVAFAKPGAWEPQQYVSIVAGRPVVVSGRKNNALKIEPFADLQRHVPSGNAIRKHT